MVYYYAIDGDDIGAEIEKFLLNNDLDQAYLFSKIIVEKLDKIKCFFELHGGKVIFCAGDSILIELNERIDVPKKLIDEGKYSFSVGVSTSPSGCVLALKKAKGLGKNRVINLECR